MSSTETRAEILRLNEKIEAHLVCRRQLKEQLAELDAKINAFYARKFKLEERLLSEEKGSFRVVVTHKATTTISVPTLNAEQTKKLAELLGIEL